MSDVVDKQCPRCGVHAVGQNRLITDSCGHSKCRSCLLADEEGCFECKQNASVEQDEIESRVEAKPTLRLDKKRKTSSMPYHIQSCRTANGEVQYHCIKCEKKFKSRSQQYYHIACGNESGKKYRCNHCPKSFSTRCHLNYHLESHTIDMHECTNCNKKFSNRLVLKKHQRLHQNITFNCIVCSKVFRSKDSLKSHLEQHEDNLRHQCNMCEKKYAAKSTLQQHMAKHREKRHQCNLCGKSFQRNYTLKLHLNRHSKTDRFVCKVCSKKFSEIGALLRHTKLHESSIKYRCTHCDMITLRKDNMLRHVRNMHCGEDYQSCVVEINSLEQKMTKETDHLQVESELNLPKTVENSSVIKCIGNVEPMKIPSLDGGIQTLDSDHASTAPLEAATSVLTTLKSVKLNDCAASTFTATATTPKKAKKKYDPIEMYRKILISDCEDAEDVDDSELGIPKIDNSHPEIEKPIEPPRTTTNTSNFSETHWRKNFKYTYEYQDY